MEDIGRQCQEKHTDIENWENRQEDTDIRRWESKAEQEEQKKRKNSVKENRESSEEDDFFSCSSMDCTGLIPSGVISDAERESYQELYPSLTPPVLLRQEEEKTVTWKK